MISKESPEIENQNENDLIVDDDVVSESNLQRQVLYPTDSVGRKKVQVARDVLSRRNPDVRFELFPERLDVANAEAAISAFDIIVDGSDNFSTRYLVNDACLACDKVFVAGSIHQHVGSLSVYNMHYDDGSRGPTLRCLFPEPPDPADAPSCAVAGVLGSVAGIVGTCMAEEVLKLILGFGELLSGRFLHIDCAAMHWRTVRFSRQPEADQSRVLTARDYRKLDGCGADGSIDASTLLTMFANGPLLLIDIREPHERQHVHMGGMHIPLDSLIEKIPALQCEQPIVLYCASGIRSQRARQLLIESSAVNTAAVFSLAGGISGTPGDVRDRICESASKDYSRG
jgi:adenylyltransferase/sulfurtransferase